MPESSRSGYRNGPLAGAAWRDVSPNDSQFLYGYPHVQRMSVGINDPLQASALYVNDGERAVLIIAVDVIFLLKQHVAEARRRISASADISPDCILISATHTHSGPVTIRMLSNAEDVTIPPPDPNYIERLIEGIAEAGIAAVCSRQRAQLGFSLKQVFGLGTNRHDPDGPCCPEVPIFVIRAAETLAPIAVMCVCAMHPTVLHEDNLLVSGDFPAYARSHLREQLNAPDLCVVYHMGAAGNQSPRHVVHENTLAEAARLGGILGQALHAGVEDAQWMDDWSIECDAVHALLPVREMPAVQEAELALASAAARLAELTGFEADRGTRRTAECDWFGAQETLALSRAQEQHFIETAAACCLPAEIQVISIGPWRLVGWPGEIFAEYAIELRQRFPNAFIITLANGDLQGYLVTPEAIAKRFYEASNAIFASPASPLLLTEETIRLLEKLDSAGASGAKRESVLNL